MMDGSRHRAVPAGILALVMTSAGALAEGVAVLKEQPFHRDSSAKAVAYRSLAVSGPYLRLVTGRGNVDIKRFKMVDRIEFPDPPPRLLTEPDDLGVFRESLAAMQRFASRYPASARLLQPEMEVVSGYIDRVDAGEVRYEGKWIARDEIPDLLESRWGEEQARRLRDAEQVVANEARRDEGLLEVDGAWVSESEALERSPVSGTELSAAVWPLMSPDLDGARMTLRNLDALAAGQTGAAKVRTERLLLAIQHLFLSEYHLTREMMAHTVAEAQASAQQRRAEEWLKPNAFGTKRKTAARESLAKARQLRENAAHALGIRRAALLDQLREVDAVTWDFYQLREHRVALLLGETVRAMAARHRFTGEFQPAFPDESLMAIRGEISSRIQDRQLK